MHTHNRFKTILMILVCFLAYIAYFGIHSPSIFSDDNKFENLAETVKKEIKSNFETPKKVLETSKTKELAIKHNTNKQPTLLSLTKRTLSNPENAANWNKLGQYQRRVGKLNEAIGSFEKVRSLGKKQNNKTTIAAALTNLGLTYKDQTNYKKAEQTQKAALQLYKELNNQQGIANNYNNLGRTYFLQGKTDKSIETLLKSLTINLDLKNQNGMAQNFGNLGESYRVKGSLGEAEYAQTKSLEINTKLGNKSATIGNLINLGIIQGQNGNYPKAESSFFKALSFNKQLNNKRNEAKIYSNLGHLYQLNKQYKKAEAIQLQSIKLNKQLGNKRGLAISTYNLAVVNLKTNQLQNACQNFKNAKSLFVATSQKRHLAKTNQYLSNLSCDLQN